MNKTELTEAAGVQPVVFCCHAYEKRSSGPFLSYPFSTFTDMIRKPMKIGCAEVVCSHFAKRRIRKILACWTGFAL